MRIANLPKTLRSAVATVAMLGMVAPSVAAPTVDLEYKLKAVFLLNFAKFVTWPASAFSNASAPLSICVVGEDPFGNVLDQVVQGETVQSHPLTIVRPSGERNLQSCHIAYFSRSMESQVANVLSKHLTPNTLSVGDSDNFLTQGGMFNFILENTKVRFVINTDAISRASFSVSSKLLSLGRTASE